MCDYPSTLFHFIYLFDTRRLTMDHSLPDDLFLVKVVGLQCLREMVQEVPYILCIPLIHVSENEMTVTCLRY